MQTLLAEVILRTIVIETGNTASSWLTAIGTIMLAVASVAGGLGIYGSLRRPKLNLTFEQQNPWCRKTMLEGGRQGYWVRIRAENTGRDPVRGCVGKLTGVDTDGIRREDRDPMQLKWAGVPEGRGFEPITLRRHECEYLNVLVAIQAEPSLRITTFDEGFAPGFETTLEVNREHVVNISVAAENASPKGKRLKVAYGGTFETLIVQEVD